MPEAIPAQVHLERMDRDAEEVEDRVRAAFLGLDPTQLTWRPPEGGWSIVECLEHLSITNELYVEASTTVLENAQPLGAATPPDFRPGPVCARFIRMIQPGKGRYKAPKSFQPTLETIGPQALDRFLDVHTRIRGVITGMAAVDLTRTKVTSPVTRLIRFRIGDMMDFLLVHSKRHVLQAEKVQAHPNFPSSALGSDPQEEE